MKREGLVHHGIELRFGGRGHRIDMTELTGGRVDHRLRAAGSRQGSDSRARLDAGGQIVFGVERRARCTTSTPSTPRMSRFATAAKRRARCATSSPAATASTASAGRRFPRGALRELRAHVSVRVARHPGRGAADARRADLRLPRARLRALQHALAGNHAALPPGGARGRHRRLARRSHLGGAAHAARDRRRLDAARGHGASKKASPACAASSSSRCSIGRLVPGRRRGAHRAARPAPRA